VAADAKGYQRLIEFGIAGASAGRLRRPNNGRSATPAPSVSPDLPAAISSMATEGRTRTSTRWAGYGPSRRGRER
jgi:hypothetical protein